jgi:hypothetical protein
MVRITLEVVGPTDRDGWEWGEAIARFLAHEFVTDTNLGFVAVQCLDVEDPARDANN